MRRFLSLLLAAAALALVAGPLTALRCAAETPPATPSQPATLVGLTRSEVVALRGKPSGERARGDTLLMIYADGTKLELRGGRVATVAGPGGAAIIDTEGNRRTLAADGTLEHTVRVIAAPAPAEAEPAAGPDEASAGPAATAEAAPVVVSPTTNSPTKVSEPAPAAAMDTEDDLPPGATAPPSVEAARQAAMGAVTRDLAEQDDAHRRTAGPSAGAAAALFLIGSVARFVLALLALRIAVQVVGLPFFWRDLMKVALLYLAVHEAVAGLAKFGGWWEFITVFRMDDVVSFVVLACSLTWFRIAGTGLTALKIALAVQFAVAGLMMAVMLALTFGLAALPR